MQPQAPSTEYVVAIYFLSPLQDAMGVFEAFIDNRECLEAWSRAQTTGRTVSPLAAGQGVVPRSLGAILFSAPRSAHSSLKSVTSPLRADNPLRTRGARSLYPQCQPSYTTAK